MRTFERGTGSRAARRNRGGILISLLLALAVLVGLGWGGYRAWQSNSEAEVAPDLIVDQVTRGSFDHIVLEQGELESSKNVDVLCEVRARSFSNWAWVSGVSPQARVGAIRLSDAAIAVVERKMRLMARALLRSCPVLDATLT